MGLTPARLASAPGAVSSASEPPPRPRRRSRPRDTSRGGAIPALPPCAQRAFLPSHRRGAAIVAVGASHQPCEHLQEPFLHGLVLLGLEAEHALCQLQHSRGAAAAGEPLGELLEHLGPGGVQLRMLLLHGHNENEKGKVLEA